MKSQPLSPATRDRLNIVFASADRDAAENMLVEQCGSNLPLLEKLSPVELERIRFAAIKVSGGNLAGLRNAIDLANTDWRDLLMSAGFGHDLAEHERWKPAGHVE